jgi:hypothetical protein
MDVGHGCLLLDCAGGRADCDVVGPGSIASPALGSVAAWGNRNAVRCEASISRFLSWRSPCSRCRLRPPLHQLDLCLLSPLPELDGAQRWSALPDQTRQTLAELLTLLLIAHAGDMRQELDELPEGGSDEW